MWETCKSTLCTVPGELQSSAALRVFGRTVQENQTRQQFSGICRDTVSSRFPKGEDQAPWSGCDVARGSFRPFPSSYQHLSVFREGHRLLLVAAFWPARTCFVLLLMTPLPKTLAPPQHSGPLVSAGGQIWLPNPCRLQLWVWPLEGRTLCGVTA